jgi:hypothetical protein
MHAYYYEDSTLSTCGLEGCGAMRLGGLTDPELVNPYKIGTPGAVADTQTVGQRHDILEPNTPSTPFLEGDIVIIDDGSGFDAHEIICVGDAIVNADGSWTIDTVEGGQWSGFDSSAVQRFVRTFVPKNGKIYCGSRFVIATVRCSRLELPGDKAPDAQPSSGDPQKVDPAPAVPTMPAPPPDTPAGNQEPSQPSSDQGSTTPIQKPSASHVRAWIAAHVSGLLLSLKMIAEEHPVWTIIGIIALTIFVVFVIAEAVVYLRKRFFKAS